MRKRTWRSAGPGKACSVVSWPGLLLGSRVAVRRREEPPSYESGLRAHGSNQRFRRLLRHAVARALPHQASPASARRHNGFSSSMGDDARAGRVAKTRADGRKSPVIRPFARKLARSARAIGPASCCPFSHRRGWRGRHDDSLSVQALLVKCDSGFDG